MSSAVIDASVALAWGFPDESSVYADRVYDALDGFVIRVPALGAIEITNAIIVAERRQRIKPAEIRQFLSLMNGLTVVLESQDLQESVNNILPVARAHGLSAYDAAYLDVALRHNAPLATLDDRLRAAAKAAGVNELV